MIGVSKNLISRLAGKISQRFHAFFDRQLHGDLPYLRVVPTYVKLQEAGRILSVRVKIAIAVNITGSRKGPSNRADLHYPGVWPVYLHSLGRRGWQVNADIERRPNAVVVSQ